MRVIFSFLTLFMLAAPALAHTCILAGSSATDMQIYNSCKADLATGAAGHGTADQDMAGELARLKAENETLKARLTVVRQRLLTVLGDL